MKTKITGMSNYQGSPTARSSLVVWRPERYEDGTGNATVHKEEYRFRAGAPGQKGTWGDYTNTALDAYTIVAAADQPNPVTALFEETFWYADGTSARTVFSKRMVASDLDATQFDYTQPGGGVAQRGVKEPLTFAAARTALTRADTAATAANEAAIKATYARNELDRVQIDQARNKGKLNVLKGLRDGVGTLPTAVGPTTGTPVFTDSDPGKLLSTEAVPKIISVPVVQNGEFDIDFIITAADLDRDEEFGIGRPDDVHQFAIFTNIGLLAANAVTSVTFICVFKLGAVETARAVSLTLAQLSTLGATATDGRITLTNRLVKDGQCHLQMQINHSANYDSLVIGLHAAITAVAAAPNNRLEFYHPVFILDSFGAVDPYTVYPETLAETTLIATSTKAAQDGAAAAQTAATAASNAATLANTEAAAATDAASAATTATAAAQAATAAATQLAADAQTALDTAEAAETAAADALSGSKADADAARAAADAAAADANTAKAAADTAAAAANAAQAAASQAAADATNAASAATSAASAATAAASTATTAAADATALVATARNAINLTIPDAEAATLAAQTAANTANTAANTASIAAQQATDSVATAATTLAAANAAAAAATTAAATATTTAAAASTAAATATTELGRFQTILDAAAVPVITFVVEAIGAGQPTSATKSGPEVTPTVTIKLPAFIYRGGWQPSTQYYAGEFFESQTELYYVPADVLSAATFTANNYQKVVSRGADGLSFKDRGEWQPNTLYFGSEYVSNGGNWYYVPTTFTSGSTFNAANFILRVKAGTNGLNGTNFADRGEWQPNTTYSATNFFSYQGQFYSVPADFTSGATFDPAQASLRVSRAPATNPYVWPRDTGGTVGRIVLRNAANTGWVDASPELDPELFDQWGYLAADGNIYRPGAINVSTSLADGTYYVTRYTGSTPNLTVINGTLPNTVPASNETLLVPLKVKGGRAYLQLPTPTQSNYPAAP